MAAAPQRLPLPPLELAERIGFAAGADPLRFYLDEGARLRKLVDELLPADWRWAGKRVLDFGCGAARVLRQFAAEAADGQFIGCDIDAATIAWAKRDLSPPFKFFLNQLTPPLALEPESLDLILAMSVFTHIGEHWAEWLAEMHRVLAPGGLLLASFLGEGMWESLVQEAYREDEVGVAVMRAWDGPHAWVFHSEWWLREHWGRGFDIARIQRPPRSPGGTPTVTHSYILVRKRAAEVSPDEFERSDPREPRELAALRTSLRLARQDIEYLRGQRENQPSPRTRIAGRLRSARKALTRRSVQR